MLKVLYKEKAYKKIIKQLLIEKEVKIDYLCINIKKFQNFDE